MDIQDFDYLGKHILTKPPKRPPPTFLSLPRKIRDWVYDYYFLHSFPYNPETTTTTTTTNNNEPTATITSPSTYNPSIQLLFTTRQIHRESHAIFYTRHFKNIFFAPDTPHAAYALITGLARRHVDSCRGQVRVYPNMHAASSSATTTTTTTAGLRVVSGYRNIDVGGGGGSSGGSSSSSSTWGGCFVSVDYLELRLDDDCEELGEVLFPAAAAAAAPGNGKRGMVNVERYLCALDWHLRITTPSSCQETDEDGLDEKGGVLLTGYIGVLNCLCSQEVPKLRIQVTRKVLKNIGSRFREIP